MPRRRLRPKFFHRLSSRSDKRDSRFHTSASQRRVLGKKSIPGMNRVTTRIPSSADDLVDHQIAFARRRRANWISLISKAHMQRRAIHVAKHSDRTHSHVPACAGNAHRNFATIRDQNLPKHVNLSELLTKRGVSPISLAVKTIDWIGL